MSIFGRPLSGYVINLSISESEDSLAQGFPQWQVNRVTLQLVAALFGQGVSLVFGHDWREDGVMEAVYGFAREMQPPILPAPKDRSLEIVPLQNLLPWPDSPHLPQQQLDQLTSTLAVSNVDLPIDVRHLDREARQRGPEADIYRYVRARSLTALRERLTESSDARVCLGGRRSGSQGRYPGIIEEALLSIRQRKPLYVSCVLGGAAQQVIGAIEGTPITDDFCPTPLQSLYRDFAYPSSNQSISDCLVDRNAVWNEFASIQPEVLARINGLSQEENHDLFHTPIIDRVVDLVLTGLSRLRK
jgi:SLOG cluster2